MYFVDKKHEKNYEHLTTMVFRSCKSDPEYHAAAYILALPEIYERCINDPMLYDYPFLWTKEYVDNSRTEYDDYNNEEYYVVDFDIKKDDEGNEVNSKAYGTLSISYRHIVRLARNLFNSYSGFNLMKALDTWGDPLVNVYEQAVHIRINREVKRQ